jgi:hypothetical protein
MLTSAQLRMEVVRMLLYTQVFVAFLSIQALLRLFLAIQALLRLYQDRVLLYTQAFVSVMKALLYSGSMQAHAAQHTGGCCLLRHLQLLCVEA